MEINIPEGKAYLNSEFMQFDYQMKDDVSGVQEDETKILYDGNPVENEKIDLSLETPGLHHYSVLATDRAGNQSQKEIAFTISASQESIQNNVSHYADLGLIPNPGKRVEILAHLKSIESSKEVDSLIQKINNMKDFQISAQARSLLIASLNFLK